MASQIQVQSTEESAASIVSEFISSLDNIPNEVAFLLREIRNKDARCQELNQEIIQDQNAYIKGPGSQSSSKISACYTQIANLTSEKIGLAEKLVSLLTRTKGRLDADNGRVRTLQGLEDDRPERYAIRERSVKRNFSEGVEGDSIILEPPYKKRRLGTSTPRMSSPALGSLPAPAAISAEVGPSVKKIRNGGMVGGAYTRSQTQKYREMFNAVINDDELEASSSFDADGDADAEGDAEGDFEEEDTTLYCLCQRTSFGDMIGCDEPTCRYQWFHLTCVGVKTPLPEKWYCPECSNGRGGRRESVSADTISILGAGGEGRKRRR